MYKLYKYKKGTKHHKLNHYIMFATDSIIKYGK